MVLVLQLSPSYEKDWELRIMNIWIWLVNVDVQINF